MQVSKYFRKSGHTFFHWCPGCLSMHPLPVGPGQWSFNGNLDKPTCEPSFAHFRGDAARACHYVLTDGVLHFQIDCYHDLKSKSVPLPELPKEYTDAEAT